MIYKTFHRLVENYKEFTLEEFVQSLKTNTPLTREINILTSETFTSKLEDTDELVTKLNSQAENTFRHLSRVCQDIITYKNTTPNAFYKFKIPKSSGGYRDITAPDNFLKQLYREVVTVLKSLDVDVHNNAHAYVEYRSTLTNMRKHQSNNSNWFLKVDIKDFFGSFNQSNIVTTLAKVYPFNNLVGSGILELLADAACYEGCLPQGTPLSPHLTNLLMIPFDTDLSQVCYEKHYAYTRYADDLIISSVDKINKTEMENIIKDLLPEGLLIKPEKTRYGNKAGRNWNLGLMLNKDNNITLGYKKKRILKATAFSFTKDYKENKPWSIQDTYTLQGELSYLGMVEPEYRQYIDKHIFEKLDTYVADVIDKILYHKD